MKTIKIGIELVESIENFIAQNKNTPQKEINNFNELIKNLEFLLELKCNTLWDSQIRINENIKIVSGDSKITEYIVNYKRINNIRDKIYYTVKYYDNMIAFKNHILDSNLVYDLFNSCEVELLEKTHKENNLIIALHQLKNKSNLSLFKKSNEVAKALLEFKKINEPKKPRKLNQLKTKLTDTQRGKLFELLVLHGFIPDKDKEGFIWAFGGKNDNYTSYSTEWFKNKNLGVYLIDSICIDNGKLWAIGSRIFDIKNMAQIKQNYFSTNQTSKPKGHELIDTIISEAQK